MTEESILDRVIFTRQENEMQNFNPAEVVATLLKDLNAKEEDVLRRRFGLSNKEERETLENIGKAYNVTRERIRQIERSAVKKIKDLDSFHDVVRPVENIVNTTLQSHGGALSEDRLLEELLKVAIRNEENRRSILFVLQELLKEKFGHIPENRKLRKGWRLHMTQEEYIHSIVDEVISHIKDHGKPLPKDELLQRIQEEEFYKKDDELHEKAIIAFIDLSQHIDYNPFEEYGLVKWGSIKPKRMNDKIYLILKKEGKPLHFNEITRRINETGFDKRKAYPPTVHNELILNKEYILVGRGIYALEEWGYKPGVVADVLADIIRENGALTKEEIVDKVLEKRLVKRNTIHLALNNKKRFQKADDGKYSIKEQN